MARDQGRSATSKGTNKAGRSPVASTVVVRFTDAAFEDLETMARKGDPQVVRAALKKCLMLERDPEAGEPLRGGLVGFRKLVVGDRDWRIVWRVAHDEAGGLVVDVAEVWAFGARSDSEVYDEMADRVRALGKNPRAVPLAEAIEALGKLAYGLEAKAEPQEVPPWLIHVLVSVVGMPEAEARQLSESEAASVWEAYKSRPR